MTSSARISSRTTVLAFASLALGSVAACSSSNGTADEPTSEADNALTSGTPIVSSIGSKCLDDAGDSTANGAKIEISTCTGSAEQEWAYTGGTFVGPGGKCLGIKGGDQANGTLVDLYQCNGTAGQEWKISGSLIKSTAGFCLDVHDSVNANGTQVQISTCNGTAAQSWKTSGTTTTADAGTKADSGTKADAGGGTTGTKSAGCGKTGAKTGDFTLTATDGAGRTRSYEVLVTAPYSDTTPRSLSFVYHGAGATSATAKGFGLQNAPGAAAAGIFVFPQGVDFEKDGVGWDDTCGGYDMPFFDHMLEAIEADYCVDESKVFAAGFSWGGDHATALDCCRGSKFRAVAVASSTDEFSNRSDYRTYDNKSCDAGSAALRFTHATNGDSEYPAPDFATTSALYRSWNDCSTSTTAVSPSPCESYGSCKSELVECSYPSLGHAIPSGWGNDTWAFFTASK